MQLGLSFSFLLTTLLFALDRVEAAPAKRSRGVVTLPLKRVQQPSDDHPSVILQQHINHSHRRHARMAGVEGPSNVELAKRIEKRLNIAKYPNHGKRYNRNGVNRISDAHTLAASDPSDGSDDLSGNGPGDQTVADQEGFPEAALNGLINGGLTKADNPTADNSLGLNIEGNDVSYIATIQVGTPPRDFSILMDSGSADFWIGAEGCKSQAGGGCNHLALGKESSSSFQDSGNAFEVKYGAGFVQGNIISDNINIAGLALDQHAFGVANEESVEFSDPSVKFDGLMGLAKSTISNQSVPTPVEALAKQGLINEAITSYKIPRLSNGTNDGQITFGGLDQSKFDPKTLITFQNVNKLGFWEGEFTASANGQDLGLQGRTAILDTGTTLILAPLNDAMALHQQIPGAKFDQQNGFIIPCTTTAVISLTFSGQAFDINPKDLLFAPVDPNNLQGDCFSGISAGGFGGPNQWLVGDVFLKNAYFSHNVDKDEISLAKLV